MCTLNDLEEGEYPVQGNFGDLVLPLLGRLL